MKRLALVFLLFVAACSTPIPEDAAGDEIFRLACAQCHAADLSGGIGPALGPDSHSSGLPDEYLRMTINTGRGRMPSFSSTLSEAQIERVIAYIREVQGG